MKSFGKVEQEQLVQWSVVQVETFVHGEKRTQFIFGDHVLFALVLRGELALVTDCKTATAATEMVMGNMGKMLVTLS